MHKSNNLADGVDLYANPSGLYRQIIREDVLKYIKNLSNDAYDAVLVFDIIEHLEKNDSHLLIKEMQRVARKFVVIVTPNGFWPGMIDGPGMDHVCGFNAEEFTKMGFSLHGSGWLAILRSRQHSFLKFFPYVWTLPFQIILFNFSQLISKRNPRIAYGLTAIKNF